jgi:hypothetical protein
MEKRISVFNKYRNPADPSIGKRRQLETFRMYLEILEDSELEKSINASPENDGYPLVMVLEGLSAFEDGNQYHDDMKELTPEFVLARPHFAEWFQRIYMITMNLRSDVRLDSKSGGKDSDDALAPSQVWDPNEGWGTSGDPKHVTVEAGTAASADESSQSSVQDVFVGGAEESKVCLRVLS